MVAGTKQAVMVSHLDSHWVHPKRLTATRHSSPPGEHRGFSAGVAASISEAAPRDNFSPVDYNNPDLARFPYWAEAQPTKCSIQAGDMLWIPAFTWHNILSKGDPQANWLNVAVNYWYEANAALADYMDLVHTKIVDANDHA
eukprot:TRINITY_DN1158_c0_g2_i1.p1 TRINITY_DN1158_c0_g2~~TRINITY_DN1158_c0_g2_i1.p1  ORF type:complete len:142 (+),score=39.32 TRINITY_DN1158_c0_g2_i1:160-585(+)